MREWLSALEVNNIIGSVFLVIDLALGKLQPATVKEIPILLVSWSEIALGSQKTPKRKMC